MMPQTRGPYLSRMVPTGRAATLVETAAIVNIRFSLPTALAQYNGLGVYEPYLLPIARYCPILQFSFCTLILIDPFPDEDRFDSGVAKDNSSSKEAVYNRDGYLNCIVSVLMEA
jgi:hypothetical protein